MHFGMVGVEGRACRCAPPRAVRFMSPALTLMDDGACSNGGARVLNSPPTPELLPYTVGTFKQERQRVQVRWPVDYTLVCLSLNDKCRRLEHASVLIADYLWVCAMVL
jgi:hypothetical protein